MSPRPLISSERDWRIGLIVKPKSPDKRQTLGECRIIDVKESGFFGMKDDNGILIMYMQKKGCERTILVDRAENWMTN